MLSALADGAAGGARAGTGGAGRPGRGGARRRLAQGTLERVRASGTLSLGYFAGARPLSFRARQARMATPSRCARPIADAVKSGDGRTRPGGELRRGRRRTAFDALKTVAHRPAVAAHRSRPCPPRVRELLDSRVRRRHQRACAQGTPRKPCARAWTAARSRASRCGAAAAAALLERAQVRRGSRQLLGALAEGEAAVRWASAAW
jgi:hypothetical protein